MTKKLKSSLILSFIFLFGLMAALCAGAFSPALTPAKADETYSETWVIKENWTYTKDIDVNIGLKINGNISADRIVIQANNIIKGVFYALGNEDLNPLTQIYNDNGQYMYYLTEGPDFNGTSYTEWKDTFGKIIFCADTSAAEYAELRAWLNENASLLNTITFMQDGAVKFTATAETGKTLDLGGAGITSIMTKEGYTLKGYATAENGEIVYEANAVITPESDLTLYAVYEEAKTPGDDSGNIGDKVNDASNKISEWLKTKTGITLSSSGVIVLAVVLVLILFKRK